PANDKTLMRVAAILHDKNVECVAGGNPRLMRGEIGTAAKEALSFVEKLRTFLPCDVVTWDERLSTVEANRALRESGKTTRQTRSYVDQVAAQMILQGYLDSKRAGVLSE